MLRQGDCQRYLLPVRQLGPGRRGPGIAVLLLGGFLCLFMLIWLVTPAVMGLQMLFKGEWFGWLLVGMATVGGICLFFAAKLLAAGWSLIRNQTRCEVSVGNRHLASIEWFGWLRFRRRCRVEQVKRLELDSAQRSLRRPSEGDAEMIRKFLGDHQGAIQAVRGDGSRFVIAPAYPQDTLRELANLISAEVSRTRGQPIPVNERAVAAAVASANGEGLGEAAELPPPEKPPETAIQVVERAGTTAFQIPPAGLHKGSKGLFAFSIIWTLFAIVLGLVFVFADDGEGGGWVAYLISGLFVVIGAAMLVAAVNMGRRSVMLGLMGDHLAIERKTLFGTRWIEVPIDQIGSIRVAPSGMEVNGVPVMELAISTQDGYHGLLSQLDDAELEWLAYELNQAVRKSRPEFA